MNKHADKCPVCDMIVGPTEFTLQYHKMYFHFCSEQCLNNFKERPGLYLKSSIKNAGEITKTRIITLNRPLNGEAVELVKSVLMELMGVKEVLIANDDIQVTYDLKQVKEIQIEELLSEIELEIKNNWFSRLKRRHIQQTEENELDNLVASPRTYNKAPR